ncbi:putative quinol monooxygenase [Methanobrevibacter sp.]|jgi:quinol monooxygenase YgiN|uniref:putative quinol monooxygenase n=1 Tax=Methanobrevibacter sp. TaxID=66852 RepID=UPI0025E5206A|nr:putative quinol monooxygenase [Methanobrevibacter sp.]MBR4447905.1 antibiotic biosynthesis monooxygenase [Methanobrevibacter sp.]
MIIVNAILPVKEEKKEEVIKQAETLINASRTHEGNISYNLYRDVLDDSLIFIEKWESQEALQAHMQTPEFIEFGESIKESVTAPLDIKLIVGEEVKGA